MNDGVVCEKVFQNKNKYGENIITDFENIKHAHRTTNETDVQSCVH